MKLKQIKKWSLLLILVGYSAAAQVSYNHLKKDYTQSMDSLLTFVNKQPVTTGILYDRIMSFSDLDQLRENGITYSSYKHFVQGWGELYRSAYNPSPLSKQN